MNKITLETRSTLSPINQLLWVMSKLRDPEHGCPWDKEQNNSTIAPYTIEEAYEVADAIYRNDQHALIDELGDLLFQIVFYAQIGSEGGGFNFDDVAQGISDKMVRRHPHVFDNPEDIHPDDQSHAWERLKAMERESLAEASNVTVSALDGVADALPALTRADKLQKRAARTGFDWPEIAPVFEKINEEIAEIRTALADNAPNSIIVEEVGDLLFSVVNLARHLGVDPEAALRGGNRKFDRRFRAIETKLAENGKSPTDVSIDELERHWLLVKKFE